MYLVLVDAALDSSWMSFTVRLMAGADNDEVDDDDDDDDTDGEEPTLILLLPLSCFLLLLDFVDASPFCFISISYP
jgi:hypothetical protein